ncbi:MAG TPA: trimethylamine methyltransferase family protein [Candidatus Limnocylindrales bacterium]|nr:trimethylamine methyltransferase family protein [Candidatus Limnocylindrales bacterium]
MWRNNLPRVNLLSDGEVEQIHAQAMLILREIGIDFLHPRALERFKAAGLPIEENRVRFEEAFILEQLRQVPESFQVQARNPANTVTIGENYMVNAPVYGCPFITDLDRGRRNATIGDFTNFDKLAQATPQIHCAGGTIVEPDDLPQETRHLDMVYSHIRWTDKPYMGGVISEEAARDSIEMSSIVFGGRDRIEKTPALLALINVNSPMRFDDRMLGALMEYAAANQPAIVTPFLMAGAMSPMGLAGSIAQQTAEALAGIALIQLVRPGAPCVYGSFLTNVDMQSGSPAFGTPESALGILASAQMARHYRIPFRGGGALTSSKSPDAQAAYESMMCMWPTVLGGVHFVLHAAGWLESALLASYEKFIIDVECLRMFEWMMTKGIPFDDEGLAMDGIREVGPGGHHLGSEHTMRNYRTGFYRPLISSTESFDRWNRMGARTADRVANEKWKQMLADYKDPAIDPGVEEQLQAFMSRRKEEILGARV